MSRPPSSVDATARPVTINKRRIGAGLLDQLVVATANAGTTFLGIVLLPTRSASGAMLLAIGLAYMVLVLNRAFVGDVLVAKASRLAAADQTAMIRDGLATAAWVGLTAAVAFAVVGMAGPHGNIDLTDCRWLAPFMPMVLLHDTGRQAYLAQRAQSKALRIDLLWLVAQATVIALGVWAGLTSGALILIGWGLGGTAGAVAYVIRTGNAPWQGMARRWLAGSRYLSGWFTATAVIGGVQVQAVALLVAGPLGPAQLTALRGAQTLILQPIQNVVLASLALVVPRAARLAGDGQASQLRRQTNALAVVLFGLGVVLTGVLVATAHTVLPRFPKLAPIAPLAFPVGLQALIYLLQVPFTAAMRGMHHARLLFAQYLFFSICSLSGLMVGASTGRLLPAVWGLAIGSVLGFAAMVGVYAWCVRRLAPSQPGVQLDEPLDV